MKRLALFGLCCSAGYLWAAGPWYRSTNTGLSDAWEDTSNWTLAGTMVNCPPDGGYWILGQTASENYRPENPPMLTLDDVSIGDLRVADNGNMTLKGGSLTVSRYFSVAYNMAFAYGGNFTAYSKGNWVGYTTNAYLRLLDVDLAVGSPESPASVFGVGSSYADRNNEETDGRFCMTGGTFRAYVGRFACGTRVGRSTGAVTRKSEIDLAAVDDGVLHAFTDLQIANSSSRSLARGDVRFGKGWDLAFGTVDSPIASEVFIGMANNNENTTVARGGSGSLIAGEGGRFSLYAQSLVLGWGNFGRSKLVAEGTLRLNSHDPVTIVLTNRLLVASNSNTASGANGNISNIGVLDLSTCRNVTISAPIFTVGAFPSAGAANSASRVQTAEVLLANGHGSFGDFSIGGNFAPDPRVKADIQLDSFTASVTNSFVSNPCATMRVIVSGESAGISLEQEAAAAPVFNGTMAISFTAPPAPDARGRTRNLTGNATADGWYYGIRWQGDHTEELRALIESGRITVDTDGLSERERSLCGVRYSAADDATYYGAPVRSIRSGLAVIVR